LKSSVLSPRIRQDEKIPARTESGVAANRVELAARTWLVARRGGRQPSGEIALRLFMIVSKIFYVARRGALCTQDETSRSVLVQSIVGEINYLARWPVFLLVAFRYVACAAS
jgi:hypothetical protein